MKPRFEQIRLAHGQSFSCLDYREPVFDCPYHFHPEVEMTLIKESVGTVILGNGMRRFGAGDVFLIGAGVPHAFLNSRDWPEAGRPAHSVVLQFREDCLGAAFFELPEMRGVRALLVQARHGIVFQGGTAVALAEGLEALRTERGVGRIRGLVRLLEIAVAAPAGERASISTTSVQGSMSAADERRLNRVMAHIQKNLTRRLTVEEVAAVASLSPSSFSRFFRRATKQRFVRFVNGLRVNLACERLVSTDDTVIEIALACGFENLANFNRRFRDIIGKSPSQYRREFRRMAGGDTGE